MQAFFRLFYSVSNIYRYFKERLFKGHKIDIKQLLGVIPEALLSHLSENTNFRTPDVAQITSLHL
jgi:hypothetical protein